MKYSNEENKYLIGLSHFPKFGPKRLKLLLSYFNNAEQAFKSPLNEIIKAGIKEHIASEFISTRASIDLDKLLSILENENIQVIALGDERYPKLLKEIYDPPALLYTKGELKSRDEYAIAVVGTRKFSPYGQRVTDEIVRNLAQNKLTIVSGLALGIDAIAHNACLKAGGRTIAVLGTGLDKNSIYPGTNRSLANKIIDKGGAIISEFPLFTQPFRSNFPQRNRIISGMSLGTLVIEAAARSGALITAFSSLEQNREVFAIPGSIYSETSIGPNKLIKLGAKPISAAKEIMETLDLKEVNKYIKNKKIIPDTEEEELLLTHLGREPMHVDDLTRLTKLQVAAINATLTMMEMKGMVKNLGNMQYVLAR
ncbi:DNA-processing protein DprA [Candidatus Parcubacteria bacterium]|nr:DNA-processing protein DprA [Candidatus Parcubacteria bacterium]